MFITVPVQSQVFLAVLLSAVLLHVYKNAGPGWVYHSCLSPWRSTFERVMIVTFCPGHYSAGVIILLYTGHKPTIHLRRWNTHME